MLEQELLLSIRDAFHSNYKLIQAALYLVQHLWSHTHRERLGMLEFNK